jgi:hypothetical protein
MQSNRLNSTAILYLFISVVIAHFLHRDFLPNWELVLVGVILGWRYSIFKGKINQPSAWVKLLLVCGGFYRIGSGLARDKFGLKAFGSTN